MRYHRLSLPKRRIPDRPAPGRCAGCPAHLPGGEPESTPTLDQIREQFEAWRQGRKKRSAIPDKLWQSAVSLCQDHSISKVSSTLRLNHAVLKHRVGAYGINHPVSRITAPRFIELDMRPSKSAFECIVEMSEPKGSTMRVYVKGETGLDLLELGKAFWSKRP